MKLISNWTAAYRMLSVQAMALAAALQVVWETNPDAIKAVIPAAWVPYITAGLLVAGIVGRVIKQPAVSDPPKV